MCKTNTSISEQRQVGLGPSDYHIASPVKYEVGCVGKSLDTTSRQICDSSVKQQISQSPSNEDYSYPNLRVQWLQGHKYQHTADGYIIIQPDQFSQGSCGRDNTTVLEQYGSRGILDHTL